MGLKGIVGIALTILAALVVVAWTSQPSHDGFLADLLINFASEAFGLILTVFLVNFLLRRHHLDTEARRMAQEILHEMDHVVWLWLGGQREFGLAESRALLQRVDETAVPARFTESLMIALGSHAASVLQTHEHVMGAHPLLARALELIVPLAGLRDGPPGSSVAPGVIAAILLKADQPLCAMVGVRAEELDTSGELTYDPSERAQRWRHFGEV